MGYTKELAAEQAMIENERIEVFMEEQIYYSKLDKIRYHGRKEERPGQRPQVQKDLGRPTD